MENYFRFSMSNYKLNNIQYKGNHFYDFNINNSTLKIDKL